MSGEDNFHQEHPQANEWMEELPPSEARAFALEKLGAGRKPTAVKTAMSGLVQRLAIGLGISSEDLAGRIPADTIRRTKYPVHESALPDGSIRFESPPEIIEGPRALLHR